MASFAQLLGDIASSSCWRDSHSSKNLNTVLAGYRLIAIGLRRVCINCIPTAPIWYVRVTRPLRESRVWQVRLYQTHIILDNSVQHTVTMPISSWCMKADGVVY